MEDFPDLNHFLRLRDDLWRTQGIGRAAVMVGAGLSLNAEPVSGEHRAFPLWRGLAEKMYDQLYPSLLMSSSASAAKKEATAGSGSLTLASEYEAVFGRQALDQLVIDAIPDLRFIPSYLHKLLLELPWADVFTTNYDTLLERTVIDERYYQVILTPQDLPLSTKPRIVKLHGSFPSLRPFILTSEDFRTYPQKFAPFVNTVQQALMENTLLLIGFSGDDPNFLHWSGWVRDELGENAPTIYLAGVLNLPASKKRLLEARGVIPIDLAPLVKTLNTSNRHATALNWLLNSLRNGRRPNPLRWPN